MGLAATAALGATAVAAPSADAANLVVTTTSDSGAPGSLRDAITTANGNAQPDTITFAAGVTGTIRLTGGQLPITATTAADSLTITGPGRDVLAVSGDGSNDGNPDTRIFNVSAPAGGSPQLSISGLTLTKGTIIPSSPNVGGALYANAGTDVTISSSAISGSTAPSGGGGAGIFARGGLTIRDTNVTGNAADDAGGGIAVGGDDRAQLTVSNSTISGNTADEGAGIESDGGMTMTGSTVSGNNAFAGAGISHNGKYPIQVTDSTISGNSATIGGGLEMGSTKYGGASRLDRTTVSGNSASSYGAGLYFGGLSGGDRFTITHSTISGNNGGAGSFGGGIDVNGTIRGELALVDSTLSGNTAAAGGGFAIGRDSSGSPLLGPDAYIALYNSTVAANTASSRGGGLYLGQYNTGGGNTSPKVIVGSTVVADNTVGGSAQDLDRADTSTGGSFDLFFSLVEAPGDAPLTNTSSIVGQDPLLGPLAANGGPTQTHLPAPTSPVIDQGDSTPKLTTDQRGDPRRVNYAKPNASDGTDIGSVELAPDTTPPNTKITKKPKKKIKTPKKRIKVKLKFTSNEAGSTFQCKLDKGRFKSCKSPFKPKVSSKTGKGKKHKIQVRAIDPAGNVDATPAKVSFRVIRIRG